MRTCYQVCETPRGWSVVEDDAIVCASLDRVAALELAHLMAVARKAAGGSASIAIHRHSGLAQSIDIDLMLLSGASKAEHSA